MPVMMELRIRTCHVRGSFTTRENRPPAISRRQLQQEPAGYVWIGQTIVDLSDICGDDEEGSEEDEDDDELLAKARIGLSGMRWLAAD